MRTRIPLRWIPGIAAFGLVYIVQGCDGPEYRPQEHGQALVATAVPAAAEAKDPLWPAANAAGTYDNQAQVEQSALRSQDGSFQEPAPAELLDALLWVAVSTDADRSALLDEIGDALVRQGAGALLELADVLQALVKSPLAAHPDQPEYDELAALLDVLLRFDLPEVEPIAAALLDAQPPAQAVCRLAEYLERSSPGQYAREIRLASENALLNAGDDTPIPGQLFQYLGATGDSSTLPLLLAMPVHRDAYASVALALIPDGSGLALLESDARLFESGRDTMQGRLAIELLAQQAHRFPEAAAVLFDLGERGLIPEDVWPHVLEIVAGRWELSVAPPFGGQMGTHTIYRPEGNQVIYRVARHEEVGSSPEYDRRLDLLDSLRRMAPSLAGFHD